MCSYSPCYSCVCTRTGAPRSGRLILAKTFKIYIYTTLLNTSSVATGYSIYKAYFTSIRSIHVRLCSKVVCVHPCTSLCVNVLTILRPYTC